MARAGLTRARVLDLAAALVDAEGPDALTATRLAEVAGVRTPSLYKHVDGLPEVQAELTVRAWEGMASALADLPRSASAADDLRALARAWRAAAKAAPGLYALTLRTHVRGDARVFAGGERVVREIVDRLAALGLGRADAVHAARAFRALVHGFVVLELADGFGLPVDVDASFEAAVAGLLRGWSGAAAQAGVADAHDLGTGVEGRR